MKYFHVSNKSLQIGTIIRPRGLFTVAYPVEILLEEMRPDDMLPRNRVVYMMTDPNKYRLFGVGAGDRFFYEVDPIGQINRHDIWYIGQLQIAFAQHHQRMDMVIDQWKAKPDLMREYALSYWNGDESPRVVWEYTAPWAQVVTEVSDATT